MMENNILSCRVCNSKDTEAYAVIKNCLLRKCNNCKVIFLPEIDFDPYEFYDEQYFISAENEKGYQDYRSLEKSFRKTFTRRLKKIERQYNISRGKILDFGCGMGYFLDESQKRGYQTVGVEVSDFATDYAREELNLEVYDSLQDVKGRFDIVTLWDVLEHLEDPRTIVNKISEILGDNGKLVITTGDISSFISRLSGNKWHLFNLPEHLLFFSPESVKYLLETNNFKIDKIKYESTYYAVSYLAERLSKSILNTKKNIFFRITDKLPFSVPMNLFDIMTIYATKR